MTTITRTEPLPVTLTHDCDPAVCVPCDRCTHCDADHGSGLDHDDCEMPGCDCTKHLAADDCHTCDATGEIWFDVETRGGRVLEDMAACFDCSGTGQTR